MQKHWVATITNQIIICFFYLHSTRTWRVILGEHDLKKNEGSEQIMTVSKVHIHSKWNSNNVAGGSEHTPPERNNDYNL